MLGPLDELRVRRGAVIRFVACRRPHRVDRAGDPDGGDLARALDDGPHPAAPRDRRRRARRRGAAARRRRAVGRPSRPAHGRDRCRLLRRLGPEVAARAERDGGALGAREATTTGCGRRSRATSATPTASSGTCAPAPPGSIAGTLDLASLAGLAAAVEWVDGLRGRMAAWRALAAERVATARARLAAAGVPVRRSAGRLDRPGRLRAPRPRPGRRRRARSPSARCCCGTIPETPYLRAVGRRMDERRRPRRPARRPRIDPLRRLKHLYPVQLFHGPARVKHRCLCQCFTPGPAGSA